MTARARLTIILALSSIPVFAGAAEERVTFSVDGLTVVGTLNLPNGVDNPPAILLLHGFPELAYSWRKVMPALADAGYYVIAPDQRGYGRTTGWQAGFDDDLRPFRFLNLVRDAIGLIHVLGRRSVAASGK